eukprot:354635-Chlamydomonas_euryale.AAC.2
MPCCAEHSGQDEGQEKQSACEQRRGSFASLRRRCQPPGLSRLPTQAPLFTFPSLEAGRRRPCTAIASVAGPPLPRIY